MATMGKIGSVEGVVCGEGGVEGGVEGGLEGSVEGGGGKGAARRAGSARGAWPSEGGGVLGEHCGGGRRVALG